jgi:CheY-like chemotaxis protein
MSVVSPSNVIVADFSAAARRDRRLSRRDRGRVGDLRAVVLTDDRTGPGNVPQTVNAACGHLERAGSVAEIIALLSDHEFDLIVVDASPDQMGEDAIRALRAAGIKLPLLFVSACSPVDTRRQVPEDGATRRGDLCVGGRRIAARARLCS